MHRTTTLTNSSWRDHTDREAREAAILTDLLGDLTGDPEMAVAPDESPF